MSAPHATIFVEGAQVCWVSRQKCWFVHIVPALIPFWCRLGAGYTMGVPRRLLPENADRTLLRRAGERWGNGRRGLSDSKLKFVKDWSLKVLRPVEELRFFDSIGVKEIRPAQLPVTGASGE